MPSTTSTTAPAGRRLRPSPRRRRLPHHRLQGLLVPVPAALGHPRAPRRGVGRRRAGPPRPLARCVHPPDDNTRPGAPIAGRAPSSPPYDATSRPAPDCSSSPARPGSGSPPSSPPLRRPPTRSSRSDTAYRCPPRCPCSPSPTSCAASTTDPEGSATRSARARRTSPGPVRPRTRRDASERARAHRRPAAAVLRDQALLRTLAEERRLGSSSRISTGPTPRRSTSSSTCSDAPHPCQSSAPGAPGTRPRPGVRRRVVRAGPATGGHDRGRARPPHPRGDPRTAPVAGRRRAVPGWIGSTSAVRASRSSPPSSQPTSTTRRCPSCSPICSTGDSPT